MSIANPLFAQVMTNYLMNDQQRRNADAPLRFELRELQRRTHVLSRLRRAVRRTP